MSKNIIIPSIAGEIVSLRELANLSQIPYSKLFFWQSNFDLIPSFVLDGFKGTRFEKEKSIIVINEPTTLAITDSIVDVSCNGGNDGFVALTVTGGSPAYTYLWAPAVSTGSTAGSLSAGTYNIDLTDVSSPILLALISKLVFFSTSRIILTCARLSH